MLTHRESGKERGCGGGAASVFSDHPDINGLSYSGPSASPQRKGSHRSLPSSSRRQRYPAVLTMYGNIKYTRLHGHKPNAHTDGDSVLSHPFYFPSHTNTHKPLQARGSAAEEDLCSRYTPLHTVGNTEIPNNEGKVRAERGYQVISGDGVS